MIRRLSCILGVHAFEHVTKCEIIAETRSGWKVRERTTSICKYCEASTPSRVTIRDKKSSFPQEDVGTQLGFVGRLEGRAPPAFPVSSNFVPADKTNCSSDTAEAVAAPSRESGA